MSVLRIVSIVGLSLLMFVSEAAADLVEHWDLDEESGLTAANRACGGTGTLVGFDNADDSHWVDGEKNGGLNLGSDGFFDNRVSVPLGGMDASNGGFTVAMWIQPGDQILTVGEYQLLNTPGDSVGFTIMNFDGELRHDRVLLFWDGNLPDLHVGTTTLEPGTWYHVAITSTGIGGDKLYYVNGVLDPQALFLPSQGGTEGVHPGNRDGWPAGTGAIGALANGVRGHDSIIDDVRIYNTALTEEEIAAVMAETPGLAPVIENITPEDGTPDHEAGDGLLFDVRATAVGATIPEDNVKLILNGEDVSAQLVFAGTEAARQVSFDGLERDAAYEARIEATDSAGSGACVAFSFGTLEGTVPGLVHYFRMDETAGLVALDTGSARNGQLMGFELNDDAQWERGICENGLNLGADGTNNNYVEFTSRAINAFDTGGFTVAMWIQPGTQILTTGEYQLLSTPGDVVGFTIMNFVGERRHDRVLLFWDGNLPDLHVGTTTLEPGTWYHVAITSTGIGGDKLYYVNGVQEEQALFLPSQGGTEGLHPGNVDGWAEGVARIGAIGTGARAHDSLIDDVRIYNRALSEEEIDDVLNECNPVICEALTLEDLSPEPGNAFHDPALGLEFEVATPNGGGGFEIAPGDIQVVLNGTDVSGDLTVGGTPARRVVTYNGLVADTSYTGEIAVTDGCATLQRTINFGTFTACDDPSEPGLVHYWRMDETSGLVAFDCVGGAIGNLLGFEDDNDQQWVEGQVDGALDLGADATINNAVETQFQAVNAVETGGFTVAMWIQPGEQILTTGEYQLLATPGDTVGFTIMNFDGEVRHDRVLLFWDGSLPNLHVGTTTLEPGAWYHVAITSTGVGGDKLYYVNGVQEEQALFLPSQGGVEGEHPGTRDGWMAGTARIGAFFGLAGRFHDTVYDEVRIYNVALDAEEIAVLADTKPIGPSFIRGDTNADGARNIADPVYLLNSLFGGGPGCPCRESCDINDDGGINIADPVYMLNRLFGGGPEIPAPGGPGVPSCGPDPAPPSTFPCDDFPPCP